MSLREDYVRGLGESSRTNGLAYGYSVALTGAFGVVQARTGNPTLWDVFLFGFGTSVTFAVISASVTRGFRQRVDREPPVVRSLAAALSVLSISSSIGACALVAWGSPATLAWFLGPLVTSAVYLLVSGVEFVLARKAHALAGTENLEDR